MADASTSAPGTEKHTAYAEQEEEVHIDADDEAGDSDEEAVQSSRCAVNRTPFADCCKRLLACPGVPDPGAMCLTMVSVSWLPSVCCASPLAVSASSL